MSLSDGDTIASRFSCETYQLQEVIGKGGFGLVYRAKHRKTRQLVAIKFMQLREDFDAAKKTRYIERFERESVLCSRLQHPNIVRLLDKGHCDGLVYIVYEYVQGQTLKQKLNEEGPLTPVGAAEIMTQVLEALIHAHGQGVIHRDIKPENIMLSQTDVKTHAMVLDFGIGTLSAEARQVDFKTITMTQEVLGTPSYSAPEQLRGEPPTPKTDIYVWGLVFLECLTAKPAITGSSTAAIFQKQLNDSNVPLPAAIAGHAVAATLRRVLPKKASERFSNATELYHEFSRINFATLVGDIGGGSSQRKSPTTDGHDCTQLTAVTTLSQSQLTERRQISVLCIVLTIRSAHSGTDIDHEIIDTLHRDLKAQCIDVAVRYGGFHVGNVGNTLLTYFGYPVASDSDGRLCARAALEIVSMLNKRNELLKTTQGVQAFARIGFHSGRVTTYADSTPEGETVNIAMDLAHRAQDNQVLTTQTSHSLLDAYLIFQRQQQAAIGADNQATALYSLIGERAAEALGLLRANQQAGQLVGREMELAILKPLLDMAQPKGNKSIVCAHILGEAGIGKSRVIFELRQHAKQFKHFICQCLPEHKNTALFPILKLVRQRYCVNTASHQESTYAIRVALGQSSTNKALSVLLSWLGLPLSDDIEVPTDNPAKQKQMLFELLITLLIGESDTVDHQRGLVLLEDLHWADPVTLEFIHYLCCDERCIKASFVLISTSREPLQGELKDIGFTSLTLHKLAVEHSVEFIKRLLGTQHVAARLLNVLVERTDGIPLFIEELVNMIQHKAMVLVINGALDFVDDNKINEVPGSLRESLQQKLDGLLYAKETAQLGATIGREFDYQLLSAVSTRSTEQLQTDLDELIDRELLFVQRKVDGDSYIFKHALLKDAAYDSMLETNKRSNNERVGMTLINEFAERTRDNPGLVAMHFAAAKNYDFATRYGIKEAKQQVNRSLNLEALCSAQRNLAWVEKLPLNENSLALSLMSYEVLFPALMATKGFGAQELIDTAAIIRTMIEQWQNDIGSNSGYCWDDLLDKCGWIQFLSFHYRNQRAKAQQLGYELLRRGRASGDKKKVMIILTHLAQSVQGNGDYDLALSQFNEAIELYDEVNDPDYGLEYGVQVRAMAMVLRTSCYFYKGQIEKARTATLEGIVYAENIKHATSILFGYMYIASFELHMGNHARALEYLDTYYLKHRQSQQQLWFCMFIDALYAFARQDLAASQEQFERLKMSGQDFGVFYFVPPLVQVYHKHGLFAQAVAKLRWALDRANETQTRDCEGVLQRWLAKSLFLQSGVYNEEVDGYLQAALIIARKQHATYLELEVLCDIYQLKVCGNGLDKVRQNIRYILDNRLVCERSPAFAAATDMLVDSKSTIVSAAK